MLGQAGSGEAEQSQPHGDSSSAQPPAWCPQNWRGAHGSEADASPLTRGCAEVAFSSLNQAQASLMRVLYYRQCLMSDSLGSPLSPASKGD